MQEQEREASATCDFYPGTTSLPRVRGLLTRDSTGEKITSLYLPPNFALFIHVHTDDFGQFR
jgi:hypothetical protein